MIEDDIPDPPKEELEMAIEDLTGKPTPGAIVDRIIALQKRITYRSERKLRFLAQQSEAHQLFSADLAACIEAFGWDLAEARVQLLYYQTLHEGRN